MGRPRRIDPPPPRINTGVRFPPGLLARIRAEAERRRVSVNRLIEWAVEDWLDGKTAPGP